MNGDPTRLQQVLWNLLANAIKFAQETARSGSRAQGRADVEITVSDDGEGIARSSCRTCSTASARPTTRPRGAIGGLGLGLAIVKQLVELHGGQVRRESAGSGKARRSA